MTAMRANIFKTVCFLTVLTMLVWPLQYVAASPEPIRSPGEEPALPAKSQSWGGIGHSGFEEVKAHSQAPLSKEQKLPGAGAGVARSETVVLPEDNAAVEITDAEMESMETAETDQADSIVPFNAESPTLDLAAISVADEWVDMTYILYHDIPYSGENVSQEEITNWMQAVMQELVTKPVEFAVDKLIQKVIVGSLGKVVSLFGGLLFGFLTADELVLGAYTSGQPIIATDGDPELTPGEQNMLWLEIWKGPMCDRLPLSVDVQQKTGPFFWNWTLLKNYTLFDSSELTTLYDCAQGGHFYAVLKDPLVFPSAGEYRVLVYGEMTDYYYYDVVVDTRAPTVIQTSTNSDPAANIGVIFSEDLQTSNLNSGVITVTGSSSGARAFYASFDADTDLLTIDPSGSFTYGEAVTVSVGTGIRDIAGNALAQTYTFRYTIQPPPPPTPTSLSLTATLSPSTTGAYMPVTVSGTVTYNTGTVVSVGTLEINTGDNTFTGAIYNGSYSATFEAPQTTRNITITAKDSRYSLSTSVTRAITIEGDGTINGYTLTTDVVYDVEDYGDSVQWFSKEAFRTTDDSVELFALFENINISSNLDLLWRYYYPNGTQYGRDLDWPDAIDSSWNWGWASWGYAIDGNSMANTPGRYKVKFYVNGDRKVTDYFVIGWDFTEHRMAKDVTGESGDYMPINPTNTFYQNDTKALAWHNFDLMAQSAEIKYEFFEPNGSLYSSMTDVLDDPGGPNTWWDWYRAWGWVNINGSAAANKTGTWSVKFYARNPTGENWDLYYTDYFRILEAPNVAPTGSVSISSGEPKESQPVTLYVQASDNTYLSNVTLHWDDGTSHSQAWNTLNTQTLTNSVNIGTFPAGKIVSYWVTASDNSGNLFESQRGSFQVQPEYISQPLPPSGPESLRSNTSGTFITGGSISSLNNPVQYQFSLGNGSYSPWSGAEQNLSWAADGYYIVKARARSASNTDRISTWSDGKAVIVDSIAPTVTINTNAGNNFETGESSITIEGATSDTDPSSGVTTVNINTGGSNQGTLSAWRFTVNLQIGENTITVTAIDGAGNSSQDGIIITRTGSGYALNVTRSGTGTGTVTSSPAGISCGDTCANVFTSGTTVTLTASPTEGSTFAGWSGACSGTGSCVVTMTSNQSVNAIFNSTSSLPTVQFASSTYSFGEGAGTVSATASLSSSTTQAVSVSYSFSNGSASNGSDFSASNGTLTIPAGQTSGSISFTLLNDAAVEPDEIFTISLGSPSNATLGSPSQTTVTIVDNETSSEINVVYEGNGVTIVDGDTTPSSTDGTDFGSVDVASGTVSHIFRIWSTGAADLQLTGDPRVVISGANASDFTVTSQPGATIGAGYNSTQFEVVFTPSGFGLRTAMISIANNDGDENPYNFTIQGSCTITTPSEINVVYEANGVTIAAGDTSPSSTDGTDFGSVDVASGTASRVFRIWSTGTADLQLTGNPRVDISGANASDFTVTSQPGASIGAGSNSTQFEVVFNPTGVGLRIATISIGNNDSDENPYNFAIQGTGTGVNPPTVQFASSTYSFGEGAGTVSATASLSSSTAQAVSVPYSFSNGSASNGSDFSASNGTLTIPAGQNSGSISFTLLNDAAVEPDEIFTISLGSPSNATLGSPSQTTITIVDNDAAPEISVGYGIDNVVISDGDTSPSTSDGTDFGSVDIASGTVSHTFHISNTGAADLQLTGDPRVVISGANAADFTVTSQPGATINAGNNSQFEVVFNPSGSGLRTATLSIANNDSDEDPYNFTIQGTGAVVTVPTAYLSASSYQVDEDAGSVTVRIMLSSPSNGTVRVYFDQLSDSAGTSDYTPSFGYANFFTIGQTFIDAQIPILDDLEAEGNETFWVTLSSPINCTIGSPASALITIVDNDNLPYSTHLPAIYR